MNSSSIPLLDLNDFTPFFFEGSATPVVQQDFLERSFHIYNRKENPPIDYMSPNRRKFYKILHVTKGEAVLTIGLNEYVINKPAIAFIHPDNIISWKNKSGDHEGHFCLFHLDYLNSFSYLQDALRNYPFFKADKSVIALNTEESAKIEDCFREINQEYGSDREDKKEAIGLQLQLILFEGKRAGNHLVHQQVNETYRHLHDFINLLEATFVINSPADKIRLKTAAEFAQELHLHPNYLNTLIKQHTGKTLKTHIQDRLLYEAQALLRYTDWDIQEISSCLSFTEQANFALFFNRKTGVSPSKYRDGLLVVR
ncbi:AraC-type DNA-binding protein [Chitinophaga sp. YR573]|uniref:helix-turn-helix domain-containing protein n=1 Tax=Chitinophaga sp. YR573 TaxID=1881040 RepID=UPI0008B10348|nr:helix-turn-helix transcriptional regulator [Chitinophaga sp. YR573]SEW45576.1 AraC-type DNA-binding protein [Chitinophaga sp. YR573]